MPSDLPDHTAKPATWGSLITTAAVVFAFLLGGWLLMLAHFGT